MSAQFFGFYLRVDDKIEALPTGAVTPDGRIVVRSENVNAVDYAGVEFGAQATIGAGGQLYASLNYTWGEETFDEGITSPADRVPPVNGQVGFWYPLLSMLWGETYVRYASDQGRLSDRDKTDPRIDPDGTAGWATWNLRAGWQIAAPLEARLTIENVLNEAYREHGSGVEAPGVNAILALEARW